MNDVETRLRDALTARAAGVTHEPDAYATIARRRERRRLTRWAQPVAAAAATAAVAGLAVVAVRTPGPVEPAAPRPARLVAIRDDRAVVLDTGDLGGAPLAVSPDTYGKVEPTGLTAAGDGATFYVVGHPARCRSVVFRMNGTGAPAVLLEADAYVMSAAVSPDGTRLAYSRSRGTAAGCEEPPFDVHVRELATGAERVWTGDEHSLVAGLRWSPDGRTLAFNTGAELAVIDTTRPGSSVPPPKEDFPDPFGGKGQCYVAAPDYIATGELVAFVTCERERADAFRAVVYDPATDTFGRTLFVMPEDVLVRGASLDASGRHALLVVRARDGEHSVVYEWTLGDRPREYDGPAPITQGFDW